MLSDSQMMRAQVVQSDGCRMAFAVSVTVEPHQDVRSAVVLFRNTTMGDRPFLECSTITVLNR
jgi:hypothetical protein